MRSPGYKPRGDVNLWGQIAPVLQDKVQGYPFIGDIFEAFTGREDDDPNDFGSMLLRLKNFVSNLFGFRAAISSRVSAIEGKIATGAEFYDNMNRGENTGGLGNGWTQGGDGQPLGIRDQAAMVIVGGITATPGRRWAKSPQAASGDAFTVSMVVYPNSAPSQYAETWLFARMNSAFTQGLAVRMVAGKCWLSRVSRSSSTSNAWSVTDIASNLAKSYSKSAIVDFKGEETVLQVSIDSAIVLTATDTVHAIDSAHRENGFAVQTTTVVGGFSPSYSGALDSYAMKSVVALASVVDTAGVVATAKVAPVSSALTAASTGAVMPVDADPVVYAATKTVADNAQTANQQSTTTAIRLQQTEQNQNAGQGVNRLLTFSGSGALSTTDWTAPAGGLAVTNGQMVVAGQAANGSYLARANYTFATDDQAVVAQLGAEANNDIFTYLCLRADNTGATGVAVRVAANSISIGTYSISGGGVSFNAVSAVGRGQSSGDSIEVRAIGNNFVALVNGNAVVTYGGSLGTVGASNRSAGVIKSRGSGAFGIVFYSFNISSFGMYDFGVVGNSITSRTGARIARVSTSLVSFSLGNGGTALMPTNFYSATNFAQGMTVTDISTGSIRADSANWYEFTCGLGARYASPGGDFWGQAHWCLIVNGAVVSPALLVGTTFKWALAAGDVAQPGVANVMSATSSSESNRADYAYGVSKPTNIILLAGAPSAFFQALVDI